MQILTENVATTNLPPHCRGNKIKTDRILEKDAEKDDRFNTKYHYDTFIHFVQIVSASLEAVRRVLNFPLWQSEAVWSRHATPVFPVLFNILHHYKNSSVLP